MVLGVELTYITISLPPPHPPHTQLLEAHVAALTKQRQRDSERENQMKKESEVSGKIF